jgi:LysR family transcriptional regulator for metE and metH
MDLDVRDLELLEALDHQQTLTAAADHLFVSQPALSQRLLRLEQRLGAPLFERRARRLVANPAGTRMVRAARITLHELRDAVREVGDIGSSRLETVRIWTQCTTNYQWLPPVLRTFHRLQPATEVSIETLDDSTHVDALLAGRVDVAIVNKLDREMDRVRLHELFEDELLAIVASDHPWARKPYVAASDFSSAHLVMFDSYDPTRVPSTPLPLPDGATPATLTLLPLVTELVIETVVGSDAVTVLPSWIAAPYLASGRVAGIQIGHTPQGRTWYAATRRGVQPEPIRAFVATLRDALDRGDHLHPTTIDASATTITPMLGEPT